MKRVCVPLVVLLVCATGLYAQQADSASGVAAGRETGARANVSLAGPIIGGLIGGAVAGFGVTAFSWSPGALEGAMVGVGVTVFALSARTKLSSDDHARINAQLEGRSPAYINGYKVIDRSWRNEEPKPRYGLELAALFSAQSLLPLRSPVHRCQSFSAPRPPLA